MTTYKEIKGTQIEAVSSDPSNPIEGQVWYNTTDNVLKGQATTSVGSWASGGALNTGRDQAAGSGTQTSTLVFGGGPPNKAQTEAYDGSSWTEVNDLNTARRGIAGAGADSTSALAFGGGSPGKNETETWNGTNWTEVNDLSSGRAGPGSAGIYTSALAFGGNDGSVTGKTETWNGTNWTEVNDLNTVRVGPGGGGLTNTAAIAFGGSVPYPSAPPPTVPSAVVEDWDGTSWTEVADLSQARAYIAGSGSYTAALCSGGSDRTDTEEWTGAGAGVTRTFTDS
jgi:hypothetical protein